MGSWTSTFLVFISVILTYVSSCELLEELVAVRETTRSFSSPNYPNDYPHNSRCSWLITVHNSSDVIKIVTREMDLEKRFGSFGCIFDYVAAFDGDKITSKKLGQWCGKTKRSYVSSGQSMYVLFESDKSQNAKGFVIEYTAGLPGSFGEKDDDSGLSMMEMVGYVVFVLVLIAILVVVLRIVLVRTKRCKCWDRSSTRTLFASRTNTRPTNHRVQRRRLSANGGGRMSVNPEVFTVPMPPPSYEEVVHQNPAFQDDAPPPYTPDEFLTSSECARNLDVSERCVYDREGHSPPPSPPPPYEVLESWRNDRDNANCTGCESITSFNRNSSNIRSSLSSQDGARNVSSFVPVG